MSGNRPPDAVNKDDPRPRRGTMGEPSLSTLAHAIAEETDVDWTSA